MANNKEANKEVKVKKDAKTETKTSKTPAKQAKKPNSSTKQKALKALNKIRRPNNKNENSHLYENKPNLAKLYLLIVVVDIGVSKRVEKLLQNLGSSMQFTHNGRGTAPKEVLNVLGVVDNTKGVVNAVVNEEYIDNIKSELAIFFAASKKNRGIAFTVPFSSVVGVKMYKYLSQTM